MRGACPPRAVPPASGRRPRAGAENRDFHRRRPIGHRDRRHLHSRHLRLAERADRQLAPARDSLFMAVAVQPDRQLLRRAEHCRRARRRVHDSRGPFVGRNQRVAGMAAGHISYNESDSVCQEENAKFTGKPHMPPVAGCASPAGRDPTAKPLTVRDCHGASHFRRPGLFLGISLENNAVA